MLVTYDVSTLDSEGNGRLRKVAKICTVHGQRVQNSVFECQINESQFLMMKHQLEETIDTEQDSLRFYILGNRYENKVIHIGAKASYVADGVLMV